MIELDYSLQWWEEDTDSPDTDCPNCVYYKHKRRGWCYLLENHPGSKCRLFLRKRKRKRKRKREPMMKDYELAAFVNELTAVAKRYAPTQQLRTRLKGVVMCHLYPTEKTKGPTELWSYKEVKND